MSLGISWQKAVRSVFDELRNGRSVYRDLFPLEALWVVREFYFRIGIRRRATIWSGIRSAKDHILSLRQNRN